MAKKNRPYKNNEPFRDATYRLIVGEGLTEVQYFKGLLTIIDERDKQKFKYNIQPYKDDGKTEVEHLVRNALEFRDKYPDFEKDSDEI